LRVLVKAIAKAHFLFITEGGLGHVEAGLDDAPFVGLCRVGVLGKSVVVSLLLSVQGW